MRTPLFIFSVVLLTLIQHSASFGQSICPEPDAGQDLLICEPGEAVQINASINGSYDRFYWQPIQGMDLSSSLTPTVSIFQTTTYRLVVESIVGGNLIANGDFSKGNSDFRSEYEYTPPGSSFSGWGVYSVHTDPSSFNTAFINCPDITNEGLMYIADAALSSDISFWCQSLSVQPNTNYEFSFWATSIDPLSPASIQAFFNGKTGGGPYTLPSTPCNWQKYSVIWNSGASTSVEICLEDLNIERSGNDFALDDIQFVELCVEYDDITIEVIEMIVDPGGPYILTTDDPVIQLDGSKSSQGTGYNYEWTTQNGNIKSGSNSLYPTVDQPGTYYLTLYGPEGCEKIASVEVLNLKDTGLFIPNAFTPFNNDGINDYFMPNTGTGILVESMEIFDRWGNRIWAKDGLVPNGISEGWDGSSRIKEVLPGTYVYRLVFRMPDGDLEYRFGDVTILD